MQLVYSEEVADDFLLISKKEANGIFNLGSEDYGTLFGVINRLSQTRKVIDSSNFCPSSTSGAANPPKLTESRISTVFYAPIVFQCRTCFVRLI